MIKLTTWWGILNGRMDAGACPNYRAALLLTKIYDKNKHEKSFTNLLKQTSKC